MRSCRRPSIEADGLVGGELLGQSYDDGGRLSPIGEVVRDGRRLAVQPPGVGDVGEGRRRAQHGEAVAGGRHVDDDHVVRGGAVGAPLRQVPELSHGDELTEARRRRGQLRERAVAGEPAGEGLERQVHDEVLLERTRRVDRQSVEAIAKRRLRAMRRVLAVAEQREQARLAGNLRDQGLVAGLGSGDAERRGDGRSADATLPENEHELASIEGHGTEACLEARPAPSGAGRARAA